MTTVIASPQHHLSAGEACFRRRTTVALVLPNADRMPPSMPKSPRRRQQRRKLLDPDRSIRRRMRRPALPAPRSLPH
jgi:hypothetical protein